MPENKDEEKTASDNNVTELELEKGAVEEENMTEVTKPNANAGFDPDKSYGLDSLLKNEKVGEGGHKRFVEDQLNRGGFIDGNRRVKYTEFLKAIQTLRKKV